MAYGLSYDICDGMKNTYRPCVLWGKTAKSWGSRPFPGTQIINNHNKHGLWIDFLKVQIQLKSLFSWCTTSLCTEEAQVVGCSREVSHRSWSTWYIEQVQVSLPSLLQKCDKWRFLSNQSQTSDRWSDRAIILSRFCMCLSKLYYTEHKVWSKLWVEVQAIFWSWSLVSILLLMFCRGYEVKSWSRFWS